MPTLSFSFLPIPPSYKPRGLLVGGRGNGRENQVSRKAGESSILLAYGGGLGPMA